MREYATICLELAKGIVRDMEKICPWTSKLLELCSYVNNSCAGADKQSDIDILVRDVQKGQDGSYTYNRTVIAYTSMEIKVIARPGETDDEAI